MYITELKDLRDVLCERIAKQAEIRAAVDTWVMNEFGISDFSTIKKDFFGIPNGDTALTLCRQISSPTVEHISAFIIAQSLGLSFRCPSFIEDIFCSNNIEKRSYLHIMWADYGRKGTTFFHGERIIDNGFESVSNVPLSEIRTASHIPGITIPDFHGTLRKKMFGDNDVPIDVSEFHRICVRKAENKPRTVFVFDGKKTIKRNIVDTDILQSNFRPPAEWYYPLFQSWFLDGSMVLLENYDYAKDGKGAETLFERSVKLLQGVTGFAPFVLKIPTDDTFLSIPKRFISAPHILTHIAERFSGRTEGNFTSFFEEVAHEILSWRS